MELSYSIIELSPGSKVTTRGERLCPWKKVVEKNLKGKKKRKKTKSGFCSKKSTPVKKKSHAKGHPRGCGVLQALLRGGETRGVCDHDRRAA